MFARPVHRNFHVLNSLNFYFCRMLCKSYLRQSWEFLHAKFHANCWLYVVTRRHLSLILEDCNVILILSISKTSSPSLRHNFSSSSCIYTWKRDVAWNLVSSKHASTRRNGSRHDFWQIAHLCFTNWKWSAYFALGLSLCFKCQFFSCFSKLSVTVLYGSGKAMTIFDGCKKSSSSI